MCCRLSTQIVVTHKPFYELITTTQALCGQCIGDGSRLVVLGASTHELALRRQLAIVALCLIEADISSVLIYVCGQPFSGSPCFLHSLLKGLENVPQHSLPHINQAGKPHPAWSPNVRSRSDTYDCNSQKNATYTYG